MKYSPHLTLLVRQELVSRSKDSSRENRPQGASFKPIGLEEATPKDQNDKLTTRTGWWRNSPFSRQLFRPIHGSGEGQTETVRLETTQTTTKRATSRRGMLW